MMISRGFSRMLSSRNFLPFCGKKYPGSSIFLKPSFRQNGFTLLEILIALFIFAILSLLLSNALHNIIGIQSRTEANAERLHTTQLALLLLSRDITQAVNRPVLLANGKEEQAFVGKPDSFTFTHTGSSNADGKSLQSALVRVRFFIEGKALWRHTWPVLDQAPQSKPIKRALLDNLESANFQYLDSKNVFHAEWPVQDGSKEVLPRAVKVNLVISGWGKLSQLYVLSAEPTKLTNAKPGAENAKNPSNQSNPNDAQSQQSTNQQAIKPRND